MGKAAEWDLRQLSAEQMKVPGARDFVLYQCTSENGRIAVGILDVGRQMEARD